MKRLLLTCLLLFGVGQVVSFAQNDDIYFNSSDIEKQKQEDKRKEKQARESSQDDQNYSSSDQYTTGDGGYQSYNKTYDNDGYVNNNGDNDYYYASNIRRFNYPFYNMGYYSAFYNPYWYDPYWSDPYWGYNYWNRPGFSISFGSGPYWNSYWGWYSWYGYPAYYSYWNYPYYGSMYGGYYCGYWNGYYAGMYGGGAVRTVTYGPRHSGNYAYNGGIRNAAYRTQNVGVQQGGNAPRPGLKTSGEVRNVDGRSVAPASRSFERSEVSTRNDDPNVSGRRPVAERNQDVNIDRPARQQFSREAEDRNVSNDRQVSEAREPRQFDRPAIEDRRTYEAPRQEPVRQQRVEQPRFEQPRYEQPRYEQPRQQQYEQRSQPRFESPRMESPRMSSPSSSPAPRSSGGFGGRR